jgi:hypothetical protein
MGSGRSRLLGLVSRLVHVDDYRMAPVELATAQAVFSRLTSRGLPTSLAPVSDLGGIPPVDDFVIAIPGPKLNLEDLQLLLKVVEDKDYEGIDLQIDDEGWIKLV